MTLELPTAPAVDLDRPLFSMRDLAFELEVTAAILRTLDIDQLLYVVLSGVTSGEGLGFNRGLFMLADEGQRSLRTSMAIGPVGEAEAQRIWEDVIAKDLSLGVILAAYDKVKDDPAAHKLTHRLGHLALDLGDLEALAERAPAPDTHGRAPIEPMLASCLLHGRPIFSSTLELSCDEGSHLPFCFRNWGMVPVGSPDLRVGVLVVDDAFRPRTITLRERQLLVALANLTAIAVEKNRLFARTRAMAEVDGLTGVASRRTYDQLVERMLTDARQTGRALSLILADVDHFKQYNDTYGHLAGDDVLRAVAGTLAACVRKGDRVTRYGGEEFAILLPDTGLESATAVARKLVKTVEEARLHDGHVTISAGVASSPSGQLDAQALFAAADRAVYQAKANGRNRVEIDAG